MRRDWGYFELSQSENNTSYIGSTHSRVSSMLNSP